jgi:pimeloyl-ACP methyl ester carboxylesterase
VVGHSYGGLIALCAAAGHPDLVTSVVAFEPPVRWSPWWPADVAWERLVRASDDPAAAAEGLLRAVLGDEGWSRLGRRSRDGLLAHGPALVTEMNDPSLDVPTFDPARLTVPVTTAAGSASLPHHQEVARRIAAIAPSGRFVSIDGAGHNAHVTHPARFARLILEGQGR